jgi:hypothetical protein
VELGGNYPPLPPITHRTSSSIFLSPSPTPPFPLRAAPFRLRDLAGAASRRGAPQREGRDRGLVGVASRGRSRLPRAEALGRGLVGAAARRGAPHAEVHPPLPR